MKEIDRYTDNDCTFAIMEDSEGYVYKLRVAEDNQGEEVYIGKFSLQKKMIDEFGGYNPNFPTAEEVDDEIVYYVQDNEFELTDDELQKLLAEDCPIVFGEDEEC